MRLLLSLSDSLSQILPLLFIYLSFILGVYILEHSINHFYLGKKANWIKKAEYHYLLSNRLKTLSGLLFFAGCLILFKRLIDFFVLNVKPNLSSSGSDFFPKILTGSLWFSGLTIIFSISDYLKVKFTEKIIEEKTKNDEKEIATLRRAETKIATR